MNSFNFKDLLAITCLENGKTYEIYWWGKELLIVMDDYKKDKPEEICIKKMGGNNWEKIFGDLLTI